MIVMPFMPFFLDQSPTAKLIKAIDSPAREPDQLQQLHSIMSKDIYKVPYGYLDQARRRSALMLPITGDEEERRFLHSIYMSAYRRIQRIHIESRP
jgi:hypothetical protein